MYFVGRVMSKEVKGLFARFLKGEADASSQNAGALVGSTSTSTSPSGISLFQG